MAIVVMMRFGLQRYAVTQRFITRKPGQVSYGPPSAVHEWRVEKKSARGSFNYHRIRFDSMKANNDDDNDDDTVSTYKLVFIFFSLSSSLRV